MVPKLRTRVRFPSSAPITKPQRVSTPGLGLVRYRAISARGHARATVRAGGIFPGRCPDDHALVGLGSARLSSGVGAEFVLDRPADP
jgi:hypothetical protein